MFVPFMPQTIAETCPEVPPGTPLAHAMQKLADIRDKAKDAAAKTYRKYVELLATGVELNAKQAGELAETLSLLGLVPTDLQLDLNNLAIFHSTSAARDKFTEDDFIAAQVAAKEKFERLEQETKEARSEWVLAGHRYTAWAQLGTTVDEYRRKLTRVLGPVS